jgi:Tol biopolymer transport system component
MRRTYLILLFLVVAGTLAAQKPFTLEQITSAPFPVGLVAAPTGGKVAWQLNARGARNIWVASPPDYRGHQITSYTQDDGQDISGVRWTPDAGAIVYVRGGDFEMRRENPNPRSDPAGVEQTIWVISSDARTPRKLGEGDSPAVSPKGDRVAFLNKDQIWMASLDGNDKPAQAVHARGKAQSLTWSPDGSKLAFVSDRSDHSFIGVFDPAAKTVQYLNPSVDHDRDPVWSPDSRELAFVRVPSSREIFMFGPKRSAEPWSIYVADAATGRARQIWRAEPGRGSMFHPVVAENELMWAGSRIVFPWERTGWIHLFSASVSGGAVIELTPGDFEVEHVALNPNGHEVVFSSNQGDINTCGASR